MSELNNAISRFRDALHDLIEASEDSGLIIEEYLSNLLGEERFEGLLTNTTRRLNKEISTLRSQECVPCFFSNGIVGAASGKNSYDSVLNVINPVSREVESLRYSKYYFRIPDHGRLYPHSDADFYITDVCSYSFFAHSNFDTTRLQYDLENAVAQSCYYLRRHKYDI